MMKKLKKIPPRDLTAFSRQLATLTKAGIPLVQALSVIQQGIEKTPLGQLVQRIHIYLSKGHSFSETLKQYPDHFDAWYCGLVAAGEQSGTLDRMLDRIATHQEKREHLKRKVRKACVYPIAVLTVAFLITLLLLLKVVPIFKELFRESNTPLPTLTQWILSISETLQNYGFIILSFLLLLILSLKMLYCNPKHPKFKHTIERYILKLPIMGSLTHQSIIACMMRTLSTTLAAGIPITDALQTLRYSIQNIVYTEMLLHIQKTLKNGQSLYQAIKPFQYIPSVVTQMVKIGEHSGTLDLMLDKIATLYEEKVDAATEGLSTLLEPLLMVILGLVVGGLIIAMYLPIFNLGSVF